MYLNSGSRAPGLKSLTQGDLQKEINYHKCGGHKAAYIQNR
jgi:hypothetical protein